MKARTYLPATLLVALATSACVSPAGDAGSALQASTSTSASSSASAAPAVDDAAVCKQVAGEVQKGIAFGEEHVIKTPGGTVATYGKQASAFQAEYQRMADELEPTVAGATNPKTKALLQKFVAQLRKPVTADTEADDHTVGPDFGYFAATTCNFKSGELA